MITLRDEVHIAVLAAEVWAFLADLPRQYTAWHPAHVSCRVIRGGGLDVGTSLLMVERLHGRLHRLRLRVTAVTPGRLIGYRHLLFRGEFAVDPEPGGARFTAQLHFGLDLPVIGPALDAIGATMFGRRLRELREHMAEEGQNLKALLESRYAGHA